MRYMLFICTDPTGEPYDADADNIEEWVTDLDGRGVRLHGDRLRPAEDAATVRVRGGKRLVTDGPFAESKEMIAGYDIIECSSRDEAIEIAAGHPMARFGRVEVREFWPL